MMFRVHFADGAKVDVTANSTKAAIEAARLAHPDGPEAGGKAILAKIKLVRHQS